MEHLSDRDQFERQVLDVVARVPSLTVEEAFALLNGIAEQYLAKAPDKKDWLYAKQYLAKHELCIAIDKGVTFDRVTALYNQVIRFGFPDNTAEVSTYLEYAEAAIRVGEHSISRTVFQALRHRLLMRERGSQSSFIQYHLQLVDRRLNWLEQYPGNES